MSIDPATGAQAPVATTAATSLSEAPIGFDAATRRLFFVDGVQSALYTVDLVHGTSSHAPLSSCCPFLQFDQQANALLGLTFASGHAVVISIDPTTGVQTLVISTTATSLSEAPIGFDPATRRLFFVDGVQSALYTVDLVHGTSSHTPLPSCCPFLFFVPAAIGGAAIPDLSTSSFLVLAAVLALIGMTLLRRH